MGRGGGRRTSACHAREAASARHQAAQLCGFFCKALISSQVQSLTPIPPAPCPSRRPPARRAAQAAHTTRSHKWSIILLAGSATLREGVESVLFLTGVSSANGIQSVIIPGLIGLLLGLLCGVILFYS